MTGAAPLDAGLMVIVRGASLFPVVLLARTVTTVEPTAVGVPVIKPDELMARPGGSVCAPVIENPVAPLATTW
jgi:hypothetical protein